MSSRFLMLTLTLCFCLAALGCTKPSSSAPGNSAPDSSQNASPPAAAPGAPSTESSPQSPPLEAQAEPIRVPAGTTLNVRLREAVGSKISQAGQGFSATLAHPVDVGGRQVIPSGSVASGIVVDAAPLGRFKGGARLQLKLTSLRVEGRELPIETSSIVRTEKGKGKRTAVLAGGGAALGALIGGLAGGGKGAAIGALAGGGGGTAGAAFTGNKEIELPAESVLSFKLAHPLEIK
jgi:hypothetical protein